MRLFDCTLRDGANVVGNGFSSDLTVMMLEGLLANGISLIEYGNAYGIGAYDGDGKTAPLTDFEYLELAQPYLHRGEIGMFIGAKNATEANIALAAEKGMKFLRLGENAGDAHNAQNGISLMRKYNIFPRYSLMKAYIISPEDLAEECRMLEDWGVGAVSIMDSAGTMTPASAAEYTGALVKALKIPVSFHGHNNLGLSLANAIAAWENGAEELDSGLLGMARSAGNLSTEMAAAFFQREGKLMEIDLLGLLNFIDTDLAPAMEKHNYRAQVSPLDIILGASGCHSNFLELFTETAKKFDVSLYKLILEVSKYNQKNPSITLIEEIAKKI